VEEFSRIDSGVADPFLPVLQGMAGQDLTPHQLAAIEAVRRIDARQAATATAAVIFASAIWCVG
jgi:hypothetical protein